MLSLAPARVKIEGESATPTKVWSFRHDYAGVMNLAERIENFTVKDASGENVSLRKLAAGEFESSSAARQWSFEVKMDAPVQATDAAYVSWLTPERGFLMLGDLLPHLSDELKETGAKHTSAIVEFALPAKWSVVANENKLNEARYETNDVERSVFFIGQDLRARREKLGAMDFVLVISGEWAFTDEAVASLASSILKDYQVTVGNSPRRHAMLMLAPFPRPLGAERWSAETRAGTTMLLSGHAPSKVAGLSQLSVPLSHELFHQWVPNGLSLEGNYDWFYEGFTLYQSLRCMVRLRLISFQDYLDAIGRAYDNYKLAAERDKISLLEASQRRWSGSTALVYQKGLLVAFLYDLTLRKITANKRTLDDVYRDLFRLYHDVQMPVEGNGAIITALSNPKAMRNFMHSYVESADDIDLKKAIAPFGLEVTQGGARTHITVAGQLKNEQRDLFRKLNYNDKM